MAENGQEQNNVEDETEDKIYRAGYYAVLLIDVLGQKEKLAEWHKQSMPLDGNLSADLINALKNTAGVIIGMREIGMKFIREANSWEHPVSSSSSEKELFKRYLDRVVKTQQFSDTLVFYAPLENEHGDVSIGRVLAIIMLACTLMLNMLTGKDPVRGGLCVGQGIELGEGDFYGPALNCAYELESKDAGHPRILVDDSVTKLLTRQERFSQHVGVEAAMQHYAGMALPLLCCDKDDLQIVDYAGEGWRDVLPGSHEINLPLFEAAHAFACAEREKFWNDPEYRDDPKYDELRKRYVLVEEYLTERLPLWRGDAEEA